MSRGVVCCALGLRSWARRGRDTVRQASMRTSAWSVAGRREIRCSDIKNLNCTVIQIRGWEDSGFLRGHYPDQVRGYHLSLGVPSGLGVFTRSVRPAASAPLSLHSAGRHKGTHIRAIFQVPFPASHNAPEVQIGMFLHLSLSSRSPRGANPALFAPRRKKLIPRFGCEAEDNYLRCVLAMVAGD